MRSCPSHQNHPVLLYNLYASAQVLCCFTDRCNENVETAVTSKQLVPEPLSRAEMESIIQKVNQIKRY